MLTNIIKIISGLLSLIFLIVLIIYVVFGIEAIGEYFHFDPYHISIIETNREKTSAYVFSLEERIYYLLAGALLLTGIFLTLFLKASQVSTLIVRGCSVIKQYCIQSFREIKKSNVKYLLIIPVAAYIYYALTAPVTHDEAATYTNFVRCSLFNTVFAYTMPNNHVLFSVIEHFFIRIPFVDLLFKLRLPAIIISLITWIITYRFAKKYSNEKTALAVVAIASTVYMLVQYSFFARGYSLLVLSCVICLYAACNIINDNNRLRDWIMFSIGGIMGFYTMPSFLYPFFTINLFILCFNYKNIITQVRFNIYTLTGVFILYLPVLIVLGWSALSGNHFVKPLDRGYVISALPEFFSTAIRQIFAFPPYILIPFLLILSIYSGIKKEKKTFVLWLICLLTPFILLTAHSVIPFHRTFIYYGFILVFLCSITLKNEIGRIPVKILLILLVCIQIFQLYRFNHKLDHLMAYYAEYENTIDLTLEDNKSYFTNALFIYRNFLLEIDRHHFNSSIDLEIKGVNADTLKRYDILILDSQLDKTHYSNPRYIDEDFRNIPINIYYNARE